MNYDGVPFQFPTNYGAGISFDHPSGLRLDADLNVPSDYDNKKPYRLILGFHWRGSEGDQVDAPGQGSADEKPYYGLMELAQGSTIFVAPDGIAQGWGQGAADLTFTDDILKQVEGDLCIDKSRIFSTGFSFGAAMSYALACARPGMLRAIVLYAGGVVSGCMGGTIGTPIPYLETHGTDDGVFPVSPVTQNNGGPGKAIRNAMVKVNGCTAQDPSPPGHGTHKCTDYAGCSAGHPVRWCEHDGEGDRPDNQLGQVRDQRVLLTGREVEVVYHSPVSSLSALICVPGRIRWRGR
jgi:poly(3-hydroxybutyrate) depolymerase